MSAKTVKKRALTHIMEDESLLIVKQILPREWVIREYKPDYGIDLAIEVFQRQGDEHALALGEHFFVQVKSVKKVRFNKLKIHDRISVEMANKKSEKPTHQIDAIPFTIDVPELLTVQKMGAASPVVLFLVSLEDKSMYFLCLNDYIEKVLIPEDPEFYRKGSKRIFIPKANRINSDPDTHFPLLNYSRRGKLLAAFNKFNFQNNEIFHRIDHHKVSGKTWFENQNMFIVLLNFIEIVKRYDFWTSTHWWPLIRLCHKDILDCEVIVREMLTGKVSDGALEKFVKLENIRKDTNEEFAMEHSIEHAISQTWHKLSTLSRIFEDTTREWFLPTVASGYFSFRFDELKKVGWEIRED